MERANRAVGRLDGLATVLPDTSLLVYMYIRKEAVLSSQIEGTQSSLSDLLSHELDEAPGVPFDDVVEVSNYVAAIGIPPGPERALSRFSLRSAYVTCSPLQVRAPRSAPFAPGVE